MERIIHKVTNKNQIINGTIPVHVKNNEYINLYPFLEYECDWIDIVDKNINFDTEQILNISYKIDTGKIKSSFERAAVIFDEKEGRKAIIDVVVIPDFIVKIDKYSYSYNDEGRISIKNNTKDSVEIFPFSSENFIRFGEREEKGGLIEIPFSVKVPLLLKTQTEIYAKPYISADVAVKFVQNDKETSKAFNITVGNSFAD